MIGPSTHCIQPTDTHPDETSGQHNGGAGRMIDPSTHCTQPTGTHLDETVYPNDIQLKKLSDDKESTLLFKPPLTALLTAEGSLSVMPKYNVPLSRFIVSM
ncbi:hypothetical protein OTU49_001069 [Cherax quadricarinatus]|uniref:Uncharacterized protein n=1 Tax=Cherax quadricarinatus TaxID=27406 RepID=A0AAW0XMQ4_CHEQU